MNNTFNQFVIIDKNSRLNIVQEYEKKDYYIIILKYSYFIVDFNTIESWVRKALKLDVIVLTIFAFASFIEIFFNAIKASKFTTMKFFFLSK